MSHSNINNNDGQQEAPCLPPTSNNPTIVLPRQQQQQQYRNLIRLCGSAWSTCGYCKGKRSHLARKPPPPPIMPHTTTLMDDLPSKQSDQPNEKLPEHHSFQQEVNSDSSATAADNTSATAPAPAVAAVSLPGTRTITYDSTAEPDAQSPSMKAAQTLDQVPDIGHASSTSTGTNEEENSDSSSLSSSYWEESSKSYSILATHLTPACYELLIERGWRRSGSAIYKPSNFVSCCPALTIRLQASQFRPTKSQRVVLRRMDQLLGSNHQQQHNNHLPTNHKRKNAATSPQRVDDAKDSCVATWLVESIEQWQNRTQLALVEIAGPAAVPLQPVVYKRIPSSSVASRTNDGANDNNALVRLRTTVCAAIAGRSRGSIDRSQLAQQLVEKLEHQQLHQQTSPEKPRVTVSCHSPSGQVFLHLQPPPNDLEMADAAERKSEQPATNNMGHDGTTNSADNHDVGNRLAAWLRVHTSLSIDPPYNLSVTTVTAHESALDPQVHRLYWEYQHVVHQDPNPFDITTIAPSLSSGATAPPDGVTRNETNHSPLDSAAAASTPVLTDNIIGDGWGREYAPKGWRELADRMLATEYGHLPIVQQEQLKRSFASFYEFLVENPFVAENHNNKPHNAKRRITMGTHHQHYTLSGNVLIAVGVVDILPTGLSSVYLFYNPSFAHELAPLGKFAIMKEIEWTAKAGLPYYYLGYYIESCPKMKYKGDYHPSELLCPTTYRWVDAELAKKTLLRDSPEHHCCTLYREEEEKECRNNNGGGFFACGNSSSKRSRPQSPLVHSAQGEGQVSIVDRIPMEIGAGMLVTLGMLQPEGQNLLRPLLQEFVDKVGSATAVQCVVNLR